MSSEESIIVRSKKTQFVAAEYELLKEWCPVLEEHCKGTTLVYLQLQTGINRDETNPRFGKSWLSVATVAERCNLSAPTVHKILSFLEEVGFLTKESGAITGESNQYEILPLPSFAETRKAFKKVEDLVQEARAVKTPKMDNGEVFGASISDKFLDRAKEDLELLETKAKDRDWNCNDVIKFFKATYCIHNDGVRYKDVTTSIDRAQMKRMIEEYSWETTRDAVAYAIKNWTSIGKGYPTLRGIYAFRERIVPESQNGVNKGVHKGQHRSSHARDKASSW